MHIQEQGQKQQLIGSQNFKDIYNEGEESAEKDKNSKA